MRFKGKVAIVTGSSRGIGKAIALLLAKEGASVVVNYVKSKTDAETVVKTIKSMGSNALAIQCDVSNETQVKKMISLALKQFGKIDYLVNNAGIVYDVPFRKKTLKQWKRILDVDLIGVFLCSKYALEKMSKGGSVVNISSTNGISTFDPASIDYDAAKAGVIMLTRGLAKEYAPHIRVNCVAPGWVNTDMNKNLPKDYVQSEREKVYLKHFADPKEIAKAVLFLLSDDASFITGITLPVDGGYV